MHLQEQIKAWNDSHTTLMERRRQLENKLVDPSKIAKEGALQHIAVEVSKLHSDRMASPYHWIV